MSNVISSEEWRDIPGYEGLYQVSNLGRVKSLYRYKKQLKPKISNAGYERVNLFKNKQGKWHSVHRLVAMTFVENPMNKPEVNHKDECKINNKASNLEWVTRKENNIFGSRIYRQRKHTDYKNRKRNNQKQIENCSIPIAQYSIDGKLIRYWKSASEYCRENGKSSISPIRMCCKGKRKTAYGFIFKNIERGVDVSVM